MKKTTKYIFIGVIFVVLFAVFSPDSWKLRLLRETKYIRFVIERMGQSSLGLLYSVVGSDGAYRNESVLTVPFFKQKYSLSCEIASLRMALAYKWVYVEEDELIEDLVFATKNPPIKNSTTGFFFQFI